MPIRLAMLVSKWTQGVGGEEGSGEEECCEEGNEGDAAEGPPKSMPKCGRDPQGGLTAKGRAFFEQKEGLHLKPGVKGTPKTPEKMLRTLTHPRGPMIDPKGQLTRLALSGTPG